MIKLAEIRRILPATRKTLVVTLLAGRALLFVAGAQAHPLAYHLEPLDAAAVERVVRSIELLTAELGNSQWLNSARLPDDALGVAALLWSLQEAVAAMDGSSPVTSPSLLRSLAAAGYENSPYVVAEWEMETERVLQAYEVLSGNFRRETINKGLAELEENPGQLSAEELADAEMALIRQASMLHDTGRDIAPVAPFRQRLAVLTRQLSQ